MNIVLIYYANEFIIVRFVEQNIFPLYGIYTSNLDAANYQKRSMTA